MAAKQRPPLKTLRELRLEQGMTMPDLADRSGISRGTLSMIERGRMVATPDELLRLSAVLGLQPLQSRMQVVWEATQ